MAQNITDVTVAVDPGITGGIAVIIGNSAIVQDPPIEVVTVRKRTKTKGMHDIKQRRYDLKGIYHMFKIYQPSNVVFGIEKVYATSRDSSSSMFAFGEGYGYWKMAATACGFDMHEITPQTWKKFYPDLLKNDEIEDLRESLKALRAKQKAAKDKKLKDGIKKDLAKLNRSLKGATKDAARAKAAELYPDIADCFKLKKHDGRAEALLIARYVHSELR